MPEMNIEFRFAGPDARAEAQALADFFRQDWPDWPTRIAEQRPRDSDQAVQRGGELVAWIALILALPGALKNAFDLAERIKLKEQVERLLAWARERRARGQRNPYLVLSPEGRSVPLDEARLDEFLDALATPAARQRPPSP